MLSLACFVLVPQAERTALLSIVSAFKEMAQAEVDKKKKKVPRPTYDDFVDTDEDNPMFEDKGTLSPPTPFKAF